MKILQVIDEDFTNYHKPSFFICTRYCDGKCWKEKRLPKETCQNSALLHEDAISIVDPVLVKRYIDNPITSAIVIGGLEPLLFTDEIIDFIKCVRNDFNCNDDIVIYTGYYPHEVKRFIAELKGFDNIIIKFGRYDPDLTSKHDEVLGVTLISDNQYAKRIVKGELVE